MKPTKVYSSDYTVSHSQVYRYTTASSEPCQQHVRVYTIPTYATLHVTLITFVMLPEHYSKNTIQTLLSNLLLSVKIAIRDVKLD